MPLTATVSVYGAPSRLPTRVVAPHRSPFMHQTLSALGPTPPMYLIQIYDESAHLLRSLHDVWIDVFNEQPRLLSILASVRALAFDNGHGHARYENGQATAAERRGIWGGGVIHGLAWTFRIGLRGGEQD